MNRLLAVVFATGVIFIGAQSRANDSLNQSIVSKRDMIAQIASCMKKRMAADKYSSYREAMKVCKNQLNKDTDNSPPAALVASDTQAKP